MKVSLSTLCPLFKEGIRLGRVATEMSAQVAEDLRQQSFFWGGIAPVQGSLQEIESEQPPTSKQARLSLGCPDTSEDPLFPEEYLQPLFSTGAISLVMGTIAAIGLCSPKHVAEVMRQASEMGLEITDAPTRPDRVTLTGFPEYAHVRGLFIACNPVPSEFPAQFISIGTGNERRVHLATIDRILIGRMSFGYEKAKKKLDDAILGGLIGEEERPRLLAELKACALPATSPLDDLDPHEQDRRFS